MREIILAANWKMNKDLNEALEFAQGLEKSLNNPDRLKTIVAAAFPFLGEMCRLATRFAVSAQDLSAHIQGAFTGEVSAAMLHSVGIRYSIIGHSERRSYHGETNELIREKLLRALESDISPILCVGESLEERDQGITESVILQQLNGCLDGISLHSGRELIIAYEPVWAIGTGRTASGAQAQNAHLIIRKWLADTYSEPLAEKVHILYGGSMNAQNAGELLAMPDIDGGLIGGASLQTQSFLKMHEIAIQALNEAAK